MTSEFLRQIRIFVFLSGSRHDYHALGRNRFSRLLRRPGCFRLSGAGLEQEVDFLWHKDDLKGGYDCLVLPGGFSYGDYLRCGAMARFSPVMGGVIGSPTAAVSC